MYYLGDICCCLLRMRKTGNHRNHSYFNVNSYFGEFEKEFKLDFYKYLTADYSKFDKRTSQIDFSTNSQEDDGNQCEHPK